MRLKYLVSLAIAAFILTPPAAHAQISFGIQIGGGYPEAPPPPPACAYGYYAYPPYTCAPYGYYGPQWFNNGIFIGAGPWYQEGWGYRNGWDHGDWDHERWDRDRGGWGHYHDGWGGGHGYVGGGFHGGGGGYRGRPGGFHGDGGFHGGGRHR